LKAVRVMLHCLSIKTVNPNDVWLKLRLSQEKNLIQIIDVGSVSNNRLTHKKSMNFYNEISDVNYGNIMIVKTPAVFDYNSSLIDFFDFDDLGVGLEDHIFEIDKPTKKRVFQMLENLLLYNCESRVPGWDTNDCRLVTIKTAHGKLKIFRNAKWKNIGNI
jgi:hypothetical protein